VPRIRSFKPECLQHRKVGRLSDFVFRLWFALVTHADDDGRQVADADYLRLLAWGYHPRVRTAQVERALETLAAAGLIQLYESGGTRYAALPSWRDHQYIQKRQPSKLPSPPQSDNATGSLPDQSGTATVGSDRIGSEQGSDQGSDRTGSDQKVTLTAPSTGAHNNNGGPPAIPAKGTFKDCLDRVRAQQPHLNDDDAQAAALREMERSIRR